MNESRKCHAMRLARGDFDKYLHGKGIDVGAGNDPLPGTLAWDLAQGDAQYLQSIPDASMDFLYSSHCFEHMLSVFVTVEHWVRVVKPGGYLYIVVPDYTIYEKHTWPSKFNGDHKQSFSMTLTREKVRRPNHWHIDEDLVPVFQKFNAPIERVTFEDQDYDYNRGMEDQTLKTALAQICLVARRLT